MKTDLGNNNLILSDVSPIYKKICSMILNVIVFIGRSFAFGQGTRSTWHFDRDTLNRILTK